MSTQSRIEWTRMTWNPVTGCSKISAGCRNCLAPGTLVLCSDMSWRPIGELKPGDKLIGFDEHLRTGRNRAIRETVVQKVWRSLQPTMRLRVGQTEVITTAQHQWLCEPRPWWRPTDRLRIGVRVRVFGYPTPPDHESADYMAGYVAGMTTGDGTFRFDSSWRSDKLGYPQMYWRVAVTDREILERLTEYLRAVGITVEIREFDAGRKARKSIWKVETRAKANLQTIAALCRERDSSHWRAGWLGGMFDAEGSHDRNLRISQKDTTVLERGAEYAASFGIATKVERWHGGAATLRIEGGAQEKAKFLSVARPALQRKISDLFGRRLDAGVAEVTALEKLGEREVVDIQTTTGTFVAAGICTHNCYAETMARRLQAMGMRGYENGFQLTLMPERLAEPLERHKPTVYFVNSMSDLFHEKVPFDYIRRVFDVMARAPQHTFQVLTKRAERMAEFCRGIEVPPNVWLGVSVENRKHGVPRIGILREVEVRVRFLSVEPLLEDLGELDLTGIHWVIVGGESGRKARPMKPEWVAGIKRQCDDADVSFFFKQWGTWGADGRKRSKKANGRTYRGKTYDSMPEAVPAIETRGLGLYLAANYFTRD